MDLQAGRRADEEAVSAFEERLANAGWRSRFGITRIGDLTGLDRIGIPVWFACRPNSRSLSVSQGKGLTHRQARLSAVMEACEHACAEQFEALDGIGCSYRDLTAKNLKPVELERIAYCETTSFDTSRERFWVGGLSLRSGNQVFAPYESVGLDMRIDAPWDRAAFRMSTVGLGAGLDWQHACRHGLRETIENDATLLHDCFGPLGSLLDGFDREPGLHPQLDRACQLLGQAGLSVEFARVRSATGIPVVAAFVGCQADSRFGIDAREFAGYACRPNLADAALAALLEAVQSRLTDISGARDDIDPAEFDRDIDVKPRRGMRNSNALAKTEPRHEHRAPRSLDDEVAACLAAGADDVLAFSLAPPDAGFSVVRILVPGFGHVASEGHADIGSRGIEALLARFGSSL